MQTVHQTLLLCYMFLLRLLTLSFCFTGEALDLRLLVGLTSVWGPRVYPDLPKCGP
jgi:hypothetical protein